MKLGSYSKDKKCNPPLLGHIPWITHLPEHWQLIPSKRLFIQRKERARENDIQLSATQAYGVIPQAEFERLVRRKVVRITHNLERRAHVEPDDFVISMRSFQGGLERAWARGCIRSSYVVLEPTAKAHVGYFAHLFKSANYISALRATSNFIRDGQDLNFENFSLVDLPLPPGIEQEQIARFLDWKTAQINKFIRNKRRLIELLQERRNVLTYEAMQCKETRWLRFGTVADQISQPIQREDNRLYTPIGMFNRGRGIFHKEATRGKDLGDSSFFGIKTGDLIFSGQFAWEGAVAIALPKDDGCIASHRYPIFKSKAAMVDPRYLFAFFTTEYGNMILNVHSRGAAGRNRPLNPRTLVKEKIPIPPLHLQQALAKVIETELKLRSNITKQLSFFYEYRSRLISDVVTGQVDVRGIEVPDITEDELLALDEDTDDAGEQIEDEEAMDETD